MNFAECCLAYEASECLLTEGVKVHSVKFEELAVFNEARQHFSQEVKNGEMHELWEEGARLFGVLHAKLARTPSRPCWLIPEFLDNRGGKQLLERLNERAPNVDPRIRNAFEEVKGWLDELASVETNPLLEPLGAAPIASGKSLFVLRDMRILHEARRCLSEALTNSDWEIVRPSSLRKEQRADRVFIFGPAWYLAHKNEEYLLRSPAASEINLIACAHEFGGDIGLSLLENEPKIAMMGATPGKIIDSHSEFEPFAPIRGGRFRFKAGEGLQFLESGKTIAAVPFKFGGGLGTYFSRESQVWVVNADCSTTPPVCDSVEKVAVDDLEAGALVLMTTSGGGDMIPAVADMILGVCAPRIRKLQTQWKLALRTHLEEHGFHDIASLLRFNGARRATYVNLRNWCSPRSIGMLDLDRDLRAVLQLVGMEAIYDDVAKSIQELRRAHQSAGHQLQTKLRESLQGKDLSDVFSSGSLEIKQGDGPAKTVFLIEERGEEEEIPEEWEGELREIDE